jgi:hypothetical protein
VLTKEIVFFGKACILACDQQCEKAFGWQERPKISLDPNDEEDVVWLSDSEVGMAPIDTGWYEGGCAKPTCEAEKLNKWCARSCERSTIVEIGEEIHLENWAERVYNIEKEKEE